jgi:hypothetical protein
VMMSESKVSDSLLAILIEKFKSHAFCTRTLLNHEQSQSCL